ncbi:MAG: Holliday junction branch migration protein RuvA [Candidatus Nitrospinota bacterium M3_3B_026]
MIAWLSGRLASKKPTRVVVETGGVGYEVYVSLNTFYALPGEGEMAALHVYTSVREDAIQLFGFAAEREREVFEMLIGVSKVGPRLALGVLSGLTCEQLARAVMEKDIARLSAAPGIGKKTAERLVMELQDKFEWMSAGKEGPEAAGDGRLDPVMEALVSLGYKKDEAKRAAARALRESGDSGVETALKEALRMLG